MDTVTVKTKQRGEVVGDGDGGVVRRGEKVRKIGRRVERGCQVNREMGKVPTRDERDKM